MCSVSPLTAAERILIFYQFLLYYKYEKPLAENMLLVFISRAELCSVIKSEKKERRVFDKRQDENPYIIFSI